VTCWFARWRCGVSWVAGEALGSSMEVLTLTIDATRTFTRR
jgi:hypothetical protein